MDIRIRQMEVKRSPFLLTKHYIVGHGLIWPIGLCTCPWIKLASLPKTGGLLCWNDPTPKLSGWPRRNENSVRIQVNYRWLVPQRENGGGWVLSWANSDPFAKLMSQISHCLLPWGGVIKGGRESPEYHANKYCSRRLCIKYPSPNKALVLGAGAQGVTKTNNTCPRVQGTYNPAWESRYSTMQWVKIQRCTSVGHSVQGEGNGRNWCWKGPEAAFTIFIKEFGLY